MLDFRMDQRSRLLKEKFYQWKHGYVIALWRMRAARLAMELQLLDEIRQKIYDGRSLLMKATLSL